MSDQKKEEDEFYVGYFDEMPDSYASNVKPLIIIILILIPLISFILVFNQRGFVESTYEYAKVTKLRGTITNTPVPAVRVLENGAIRTIPIVTFGKKGGAELLSSWMGDIELDKEIVEVEGKLIYYNSKTLVEIADAENLSKVQITEHPTIEKIKPIHIGQLTVEGEITDPKCFFGVMKPAYGKPHRSCAIRCISGGIPPVFATKTEGPFMEYYFIKGQNGEDINQDLLPWVGDQLKLTGEVWEYDDWKEIRIKSSDDFERLYTSVITSIDSKITICMAMNK